MATLYENHFGVDDDASIIDHADDRAAQTFTTTGAYTISSVMLKLYRVSTPGEITVTIRTTSGGEPTAVIVATGTTDGDTLTIDTSGEWREITFVTPGSLNATTVYAIVVSVPGAEATKKIHTRAENAISTYANGRMFQSSDAEANWDAGGPGIANWDIVFKNYGGGILADHAPVDKKYSKRLVAIGDNEVWIESAESGIATGGTATSLLDSTRSEANDHFNDWTLTVISGTGVDETATVTNYVGATGAFEFTALSGGSTPDTTSRYVVAKMAKVIAATGLDTTDVLNAAVVAQKLFIVNGTIKKVLDFVNTKITTTDVGAHPPDFGTIITSDGTDNPSMIVDYITHETANGECTIYGKRTTTATFGNGETITGTNPTTSPYAGDISFDINADEVAPPHWYNYTVFGNNTDSANNFGVMPTKVYQICKYRGRVQLCGDPNYPHQFYQSRQLNPFDYLFAPGDAQSPVAGNNADCSEVGDIIVTAIPYSDDILVYGCAGELWVMHGDAAFGGELGPLDKTTGILGDKAWCWDDKVNLYMMCTVGLLRIPQGFGQTENLTRELYPDFISDLAFDPILHRITLAFSADDFGIHIFKTTLTTGACTAWWYDLRTEGLFPDAIPTAMGIYSAFYYQSEISAHKKLLVGCADGYIKSFDKNTKNDDGTTITSYIGFAPLALSTHPRKDGIIKNIDIVTGIGDTDSDSVTCTVHIARTAAQIIKKLDDGDTAAFTKVFIAPNWSRSNLDRRSIRGQWGAIVLTNSANTESWSMERLIVDSKEIGRSI